MKSNENQMTREKQLLKVVYECASEADPRPGGFLAEKMGISTELFYTYVQKALDRGKVSRVKIEGRKFWRFYLTEAQALAAGLKGAEAGRAEKPGGFGLILDTEEIAGRISYLRRIKETTVLGEHAMLAAIIDDYERTLKMRKAIINRMEKEPA